MLCNRLKNRVCRSKVNLSHNSREGWTIPLAIAGVRAIVIVQWGKRGGVNVGLSLQLRLFGN